MKKQKDMDWELFELLEGELTGEQEAELLSKIEGQSDLESEWAFMQMTQLETPEVTYKHKDKLLKKDTTLLTFTAIQWKRVVAIAAMLMLCYPIWNYLIKTQDSGEGIVGSASEIIPKNEVEATITPESLPVEVKKETVAVVKQNSAPVKKTNQPKPTKVIDQTNPDLKTPFEVVSINSTGTHVSIANNIVDVQQPRKAMVRYNMDKDLPRNESRYKGVRSTVNTGLALLATPFRESKIQVQPTDKKTIQIVYSSMQYNATAMVSLKPLK